MPLLNKQEHAVDLSVPPGVKETDSVFIIPGTGEIVLTYEEYVAKWTLYNKRQWQDKYSGQGGSTFQDALQRERRFAAQLGQIPSSMQSSIARQVHESSQKLEDLINHIHASVASSSPTADKENGGNTSTSPPTVSKRLLRVFVTQVAARDKGMWRLRDSAADQYGLPRHTWSSPPAGPSPAKAAKADVSGKKPAAAAAAAAVGEGRSSMGGAGGTAAGVAVPLTLEEAEKSCRPGTVKAAAFAALRTFGAAGARVEEVVAHCISAGLQTEWTDSGRKGLQRLLSKDTAVFARVAKGRYALAGLPGVVPLAPEAKPPLPPTTAATEGAADSGAAVQGVAGAERILATATAATVAKRGEVERAKAALAAAEEALAAAKDKAKAGSPSNAPATQATPAAANGVAGGASSSCSPAGMQAGTPAENGAAGDGAAKGVAAPAGVQPSPGAAGLTLPPHLLVYSGPDDRKKRMAWERERKEALAELEDKKDQHKQQQRLAAAKQRADATKAQMAAVAAAQAMLRAAAAALLSAEKAEMGARRALEKERQRQGLAGAKEAERAEREAARLADKEERERRRAEALAARRYPIDDMEHLTEQVAAAAAPNKDEEMADVKAEAAAPVGPLQLDVLEAPCSNSGSSSSSPQGPVPSWRPAGDGQQLAAGLYVADTLTSFSKQLGLRGGPTTLTTLMGHLGAASGRGGEVGSQVWLSDLYTQLMEVLLADMEEAEQVSRREERWLAALAAPGAWPEVVRAALVSWDRSQEGDLLNDEARAAVCQLRAGGVAGLTPSHHLALLGVLVDEALDTSRIRSALSSRMEGAAEAAQELRGEIAEVRRKLRELVDADKAAKKARKAEALAHQAQVAMQRAASTSEAAASTALEGAAAQEAPPAGGAGGEAGPPAKKAKKSAGAAGAGGQEGKDGEEVEPDWSLPAELEEYSGDPNDKKAKSAHRKQRQEALARIEKDKEKWKKGQAARAKAAAEAARAAEAEERKHAAAKQQLEDKIAQLNEALERELERHAVRRAPLGCDRTGRCYWWGLAGHSSSLLVQQDGAALEVAYTRLTEAAADAVGTGSVPHAVSTALQGWREGLAAVAAAASPDEAWGDLGSLEGVEALLGRCDVRGVREKELKAALERELPALAKALKKVAAGREARASMDTDAAVAERLARLPPPRALPSRAARAVAEAEIKRTSITAAPAAPPPETSAPVPKPAAGSWESEALSSFANSLADTAAAAAAAKAPAPAGGWAGWRRAAEALGNAAHGAMAAALDSAWAAETEEVVAAAVQGGEGLAAEPSSGRTLVTAVGAKEAAAAAAAGWAGTHTDAAAGQLAVAARLRLLQLEQLLVEATGELAFLGGGSGSEAEEEEEGQGEADDQPAAAAAPGPASGKGRNKRGRSPAEEAQPAPAPAADAGDGSGAEDGQGKQRPNKKQRRGRAAGKQAQQDNDTAGSGRPSSSMASEGTPTKQQLDHSSAAAVEPPSASRRRAVHGMGLSDEQQAAAPSQPEEDVWSDSEAHVAARRAPACLWRAAPERAAWRAWAAAATSPAQLAYGAAVLAWQAAGPLAEVGRRNGAGGKKRR